MALQLTNTLLILPILLLMFALPILLEVFLATRQNKWLGLILPVIFALWSLVMLLNLAYISAARTMVLLAFVCVLPAIIMFVTYALCRRHVNHRTRRDEMAQMNIQDL